MRARWAPGIAQVVAASGRRVSLHDPFPGAVERGLAAIEKSLGRLGADVEGTLARIEPADDLVAAELMIEAITEDAAAKEELFRRADGVLPGRGDPRLQHELDPDHVAGRGDDAAGPRDRHALLQPGAGAASSSR